MAFIFTLVIPFIFMFGIMYLLLIRPQKKKEDARVSLVNSLQKGDRIRTFGGIIGNVTAVNDNSFVVRSASSEIEILKEAVASKVEIATEVK